MSRACPDDYEVEAQYRRHTPLPALKVEMTYDQLRELGKNVRKDGFTTTQVQAFLTLYQRELDDLVTQTVREFITKKIGK
jgi:hypothetical protein